MSKGFRMAQELFVEMRSRQRRRRKPRPDRGITVAAFAQHLRVPRSALSRVVNGKPAVSAELAIRLAAALRGSAESWLRMQMTHDLWRAQKTRLPKIRPVERGRSSKDVGTLAKFFADSPCSHRA
jgi:addiction module HigA family antidote